MQRLAPRPSLKLVSIKVSLKPLGLMYSQESASDASNNEHISESSDDSWSEGEQPVKKKPKVDTRKQTDLGLKATPEDQALVAMKRIRAAHMKKVEADLRDKFHVSKIKQVYTTKPISKNHQAPLFSKVAR